jgi:hypothetical protein
MKKYLTFLSIFFVSLITLTQVSFAATSSTTNISLNNAYPKKDGSYTVVVRENPGTKLALYVNDKNPTYATANKQSWATFRKVNLVDNGKISFTKVLSGKKSTQKAINYVRYTSKTSTTVAFLASNPTAQQTTPSSPTPAPTPAPKVVSTPAPTPAPAPQPTCTNGSYVNSAGNTICSPETVNSTPAGATAVCNDGTYSFSQTHSGTCSHHGGVGQWL